MYKITSKQEFSPLIKLAQTPQRFEFFQAVRLLMQLVNAHNRTNKKFPINFDFDPKNEVVRFKAAATLKFPVSEIAAAYINFNAAFTKNELQVNFLSLYGANGLLPYHYSELIIQRLQAKDTALRDFLDLFNHRLVSLFYKSWEKYHFYVTYERANYEGSQDSFTQALAALIGNGTAHLQERTAVPDEAYLFYAGLFAPAARSAAGLAAILSDYFDVKISIKQFQGKWAVIKGPDCTRLANVKNSKTAYNQLGRTTLLGQRTWDTQSSFTIKIGALSYQKFLQFLPNGQQLALVNALTRRYVGLNLNFAMQLVLHAAEVPVCALSQQVYLGWNTWLKGRPFANDTEDTLIHCHSFGATHVRC